MPTKIVEDFNNTGTPVKWFEGNHFIALADSPLRIVVTSALTFAATMYGYTGNRSFENLSMEAKERGLDGVDWNEDVWKYKACWIGNLK